MSGGLSEALRNFERVADDAFESHQLPHPNGYIARWYLLTVAEDSQRIALCTPFEDEAEGRVEFIVDRSKYSLRSCLARVAALASDWSALPLPNKAIPQLYERAQSLFLAGIDHAVVSQICGSAYNDRVVVTENAGVFRVDLVEGKIDTSYGALEAMRQSAGEFFQPHYTLFWMWNAMEETRPAAAWQIAESTRLKGRRIRYEYDQKLAIALAGELAQAPFLLPDAWQFSWGGRHETTVLVNALSVRLFYHLAAIQFGSQRFKLRGGAEHDLCLVQDREQWLEDIELMSSVERPRISQFLDQLTYGQGMTNPDQALQPFVPLGHQQLAVGPLGWLSSNQERNLLSLQARLQPKDFNRQSSLFEKQMTDKLVAATQAKWPLVVAGRRHTGSQTKEEIDVLVCEPATKTVLALELRWMLPPGDPREVQQRATVCLEKVDQARVKREFVKRNLAVILKNAFAIEAVDASAWSVDSLVVIEGFGGTLSSDPEVPVIPEWVLLAGMNATSTLRDVVPWAKGLTWLPRTGRDYEVVDEARPWVADYKLLYPAIIPKRAGRSFLVDATAALNAAGS